MGSILASLLITLHLSIARWGPPGRHKIFSSRFSGEAGEGGATTGKAERVDVVQRGKSTFAHLLPLSAMRKMGWGSGPETLPSALGDKTRRPVLHRVKVVQNRLGYVELVVQVQHVFVFHKDADEPFLPAVLLDEFENLS